MWTLLYICLLFTFLKLNKIFKQKIRDQYPRFDVDAINNTQLRDAYFELAQGGSIEVMNFRLDRGILVDTFLDARYTIVS